VLRLYLSFKESQILKTLVMKNYARRNLCLISPLSCLRRRSWRAEKVLRWPRSSLVVSNRRFKKTRADIFANLRCNLTILIRGTPRNSLGTVSQRRTVARVALATKGDTLYLWVRSERANATTFCSKTCWITLRSTTANIRRTGPRTCRLAARWPKAPQRR
jgi:hypothetical protein